MQELTCLGVVPVFVNAGAAVLPAVFAGLVSALALLFKPRELVRACREKPHIPLIVLAVGALLFFVIKWTVSPAAPAETAERRMGTESVRIGTDWSKVALEIIRQEERARLLGNVPDGEKDPGPNESPAGRDAPLVYRVDYQRGGYMGGPSPTGLAMLWDYRQDDTMVLSSPLVDGERVYCASALLDPSGTFGSVFCLDVDSGRKVWETFLKSASPEIDFKGFFSSPALTADGKSLIIGQGLHIDDNSELVCLDAATGRINWMVPTPLHVESSPAIEGDIVVVGAGAVEDAATHKPKGDPEGRGHPGYVFGVRISDGKELWRFPLIDPESSPAIHDGVAYIGSGLNGSGVAALKIAGGLSEEERLVWKADTPFPATGSVTLFENMVLIGCGNGDFVFASPNPEGMVMALDRETGKELWSVPMPDAVLGTIAVRDEIAVCPVRNGEIVALDLKQKGAELWRTQIGKNGRPALAGPAFTGSRIYATTSDGNMAVLDAKSGDVLENVYINHEDKPGDLYLTFSSPLVAGGRVFVGSETGGLRCYVGSAKQ